MRMQGERETMNASSRAIYLLHVERRMALLAHWGLLTLGAWLWWPEHLALLLLSTLFALVLSLATIRPPNGWSRRQVFVFSSTSYVADVLLALLIAAAPSRLSICGHLHSPSSTGR